LPIFSCHASFPAIKVCRGDLPPAFILLPALLRPARDDVFLRQQGRGLALLDGDGIGLDEGIVLVTVALDQTGVAVFKVKRAASLCMAAT